MFEIQPGKVLYCYGIYQPFYEKKMEKELLFITCQQGLPSTADLEALAHEKIHVCNLVCLDNIMESVTTSWKSRIYL